MARPPRLQKLTVALLKAELTREDVLRDPNDIASHVVPSLGEAPSLFVASTSPHPPPWQGFLDAHVAGGLTGLYAASSSAVLLVEASKRLFAVTFGQGRHLLNAEAFEHDFGLKVVLNGRRLHWLTLFRCIRDEECDGNAWKSAAFPS